MTRPGEEESAASLPPPPRSDEPAPPHPQVQTPHAPPPPAPPQRVQTLGYGGPERTASPLPVLAFGFALAALGMCLLSQFLDSLVSEDRLAPVAGAFALAALALSWVAARQHRKHPTGDERRVRGHIENARWLAGIALVLLVAVAAMRMTQPLGRSREAANMVKCLSNLRQIGQVFRQYETEFPGQGLPATLDDLVAYAALPPDVCCCLSAPERPAPGQPLVFGRNLSYLYVGAGLVDGGPTDVVMIEPMGNHRGAVAVLYADWSATFVRPHLTREQVQALIDSGRVPPGTDMSQFLPPGW